MDAVIRTAGRPSKPWMSRSTDILALSLKHHDVSSATDPWVHNKPIPGNGLTSRGQASPLGPPWP
jgi:hypothetical protein